jgi:2-polyprenyl-3-methyl-5-hydroxy-6-metoxy-1,4-benzoquinol methylase
MSHYTLRRWSVQQSIQPGLEFVVCNLCAGSSSQPFAQRDGMQIVQCANCGLVYVNPRPTIESIVQHYNSGRSSRIQYYLDVEVADKRTFALILDLAEYLSPKRGNLLDIGPNIGTCLVLARERGWHTYGVEINVEAAHYCREQRGLNVVDGSLEPDIYAANYFDIVLMGDVIEHLRSPFETMRTIERILKPGGFVIISTPNIENWAGRLLQIKPEEHLYYFTPRTIEMLLHKAGLHAVGVRCLDRYHNLTAMNHSTTFGGLLQRLGPLFKLMHGMIGDLVVKLPLRENLIAIASKPGKKLL